METCKLSPPRPLGGMVVLLGLFLMSAACAPRPPDYRVSPGALRTPPQPPMPRRVSVVIAQFPVGDRLADFHIVDPQPTGSREAATALRDALEAAARKSPELQLVPLQESDAPSDAWRERCAALVLEILRTTWKAPSSWAPAQGPPTLTASLGDGLRDWGQEHGVDGLLVGWGQSVIPQSVDEVLGAGSAEGFTTGMLQYVVLVVDTASGDVMWMAQRNRLLGGSQAVVFEDVRNAWVAEKYVDLLLADFPGL